MGGCLGSPCAFGGVAHHPGRAFEVEPAALWGLSGGLQVSLSTAGCTFEEDGDPNQCEYSQGEDDDFGWELVRSYMMPHLTADLPHGESQSPVGPRLCPWGPLPPTHLVVLYPRAGPRGFSWFNSCGVLGLTCPRLCGQGVAVPAGEV